MRSYSLPSAAHAEFRTRDLALAATLLHEDKSFIAVDRSRPRAEFVFADSENLREIVRQYWTHELICPAQSLLASLKRAKHLLYDPVHD